ncbi:MAG: NifB/NifX family molybdenum-iron cluster-binding protein [Eubacteriales bacterium]|nr:NifB/NifX family molybdenum-iron cluster-binding protein [Eubacteriales bacterium]
MIVAIPTDENNAATKVCVSFGRAPYFLFYNLDTGKGEYVQNPAAEASGGAGLKAAQFVVDHGTNIVITIRAGENAADVLKTAEIAIWKAMDGTAEENIAALKAEKLTALTNFHPGFHGKQ